MSLQEKQKMSDKQKLSVSILVFLISIMGLISVTVAWFSIADFTRVNSMRMEITTGKNLRFDLDGHDYFDDYTKTLSFRSIADRIKKNKGFDLAKEPLEPVTTEDGVTFTYEDGKIVKDTSGAYLEFELHFMATCDMVVHLSSENSEGASDGTLISSSHKNLPSAMRIAFTSEQGTCIYDPGLGDKADQQNGMKVFGLLPAEQMILNDNNQMFSLKKDIDYPVMVRVWLEGTDPFCTDELRKADYSIRLRFVGTDENNNPLEDVR